MIALCGCEHCRGKVMLKKQILKEMVNDIQVIRMVVNKIEGDLKIVMVKKQILKEILHNIQIINMIEGDLKIVGFN
ncbi:unnamed protein product [Acanthoscelides obtectus]|uniref:Uncharacterized protein n=1 Tax=Acanthoscelides obtectus TaxID=200917 RepID=A0A9P0VQ43_ACAOB|nr:unnamed protein product [Acanthoscelides obtectus]CAK1685500.1 hypothetical protein AOBTE_LOCUS35457 [Acanthoscelides obtectus]